MSRTGSLNGSFCGNFIYDQLLKRRSHFLHDLFRAVDLAVVKAALKDFYVDWDRDPWDPVLIFKLVFLQFLYDLSVRQLEERATWVLNVQALLGPERQEMPHAHTTLCRSLQRLGAEDIQKL